MKIVFILLLVIHVDIFAQHQERTLFVYNVGFGGITSGIGAIINKPKEVNWKRAFTRGLWQGSIGGLLNYSGKKTLYLVNKNNGDMYALPAKLLHAAGYSIIENAALYNPFLQNWSIDYGLVRFDFSFGPSKKFKARLLPEAVVATVLASKYGKFDLSTSLKTGDIIFKSNRILDLPNRSPAEGVTFGRATVYVQSPPGYFTKHRILSHELVHRFQYNEYQVFNTWLKPAVDKIKSKVLKTVFSKYIYPDVPYFFVPYYVSGHYSDNHYYRNFYEFEADRFATNAWVPR